MLPTTLEEAKKSVYNRWAGNPKGTPYKEGRCAYEVWDKFVTHQCCQGNGKGINGLYCGTHAKKMGQSSKKLILPKAIKSLNVTQGGRTWHARHKRNKADRLDWERLLRSEMVRNDAPRAFAQTIRITRVWGKRERAFDKDNLIGGCKSLVDAMKGLLIEDDAPGKCNISYDQVRGPLVIYQWPLYEKFGNVQPEHTIIELNYE